MIEEYPESTVWKVTKKIAKKLFWESNLAMSHLFGYSLLGIRRSTAMKILLIGRSWHTSSQDALKLYQDNPEKFEKVFEGVDLEWGLTDATEKVINIELCRLYNEFKKA